MPCTFDGANYSYRTDRCRYSDSDSWHRYAQDYVQVWTSVERHSTEGVGIWI
jgi:hypothetical protein